MYLNDLRKQLNAQVEALKQLDVKYPINQNTISGQNLFEYSTNLVNSQQQNSKFEK